MADNPATGNQRAGGGAGQVLVAEPGEPTADNLLPAEHLRPEDLRAEHLLAGDLLVEEISIDGMCGVY